MTIKHASASHHTRARLKRLGFYYRHIIVQIYRFDFILLLFFYLSGCKCRLALSSCSIVLLLFSVVMLYCFCGTNEDR